MGEFGRMAPAPEERQDGEHMELDLGHSSTPGGRSLEDLSFEELEQTRAALEAEEAELMGVDDIFAQENYRELRALSEKIAQIEFEIASRVFDSI